MVHSALTAALRGKVEEVLSVVHWKSGLAHIHVGIWTDGRVLDEVKVAGRLRASLKAAFLKGKIRDDFPALHTAKLWDEGMDDRPKGKPWDAWMYYTARHDRQLALEELPPMGVPGARWVYGLKKAPPTTWVAPTRSTIVVTAPTLPSPTMPSDALKGTKAGLDLPNALVATLNARKALPPVSNALPIPLPSRVRLADAMHAPKTPIGKSYSPPLPALGGYTLSDAILDAKNAPVGRKANAGLMYETTRGRTVGRRCSDGRMFRTSPNSIPPPDRHAGRGFQPPNRGGQLGDAARAGERPYGANRAGERLLGRDSGLTTCQDRLYGPTRPLSTDAEMAREGHLLCQKVCQKMPLGWPITVFSQSLNHHLVVRDCHFGSKA